MDRPRRGPGPEPFAVALIFACIAAALVAVISAHRRGPSPRPVPATPVLVAAEPEPEPVPKPAPAPPPPPPPAPPEDPTARIVAELGGAESEQRAEADKARRRIAAVEGARLAAEAESGRWKRSLAVAKAQLAGKASDALRVESKAQLAGMERDALARRRDFLKKTLERDKERPGYAVLPHKGLNGTWQRPIVLECKDGSIALRPNGPTFDLGDIVAPAGLGLRGSPFASAIAREAVRIQRQSSPDGGDITPYIFFIVRPDGIRAYYEARTRLERLGIAFGYELADAAWAIDVPDLDQPSTWDGSPPPADPDAPPGQQTAGDGRGVEGGDPNPFIWPKSVAGLGEGGGSGEGPSGLGTDDHLMRGRRLSPDAPGLDADGPGGMAGMRRGGFARGGSPDLEGIGPRGGGTGLGRPGRALASSGDRPGLGQTGGRGAPRGGDDPWGRALRVDDPNRPVGLEPLGRGDLGDGPSDPTGAVSGRSAVDALRSLAGRLAAERAGGVGNKPIDQASPNGDPPPYPPPHGGRGLIEPSPLAGEGRVGGGIDSKAGRRSLEPSTLAGEGMAGGGVDGGGNGVQQTRRGQGRDAPGGTGRGAGSSGTPDGGEAGPGGRSIAGGSGGQGDGVPGDAGAAGGGPGGLGGGSRPERAMEMVLACGPKGVAVHPGDYRVTQASLNAKDTLLVAQLRAIVRREQASEPGVSLRPSIKYLVEPGGRATYAVARAQVSLSGLDWPSTIQVSGGEILRLFSSDDW